MFIVILTFYLVKAKPKPKNHLSELRKELDAGKIVNMKPFGKSLQKSLENARMDGNNPGYVIWVEEDYCSPPLAMERESVLDRYFDDISVERVDTEQDGWNKIKGNQRLWIKIHDRSI